MLAVAAEAGWPIQDDDRERLLAALTRFVQGKLVRYSALQTADLNLRKLAALDALSRYGPVKPSLLDSLNLDAAQLPTSGLLDLVGVLERSASLAHRSERLANAWELLRARLNFQGTRLSFSTERTDALWWLMISSDSNANRLLLAALPRAEWREDIARLVRGALGRQQRGHWNTTVANAWGTLAMEKFAAAFEATPVSGSSSLRYGTTLRQLSWPQADGAVQVDLPWQGGTHELQLGHSGAGAPWAMVRATAAMPLAQALSSGLHIVKSMRAVEQKTPGVWSRGDVVRVHLDLEAQTDSTWVVVDDPIPAGSSVLGSGLGGQSTLLQRDDHAGGWAWMAFEERRFDGYRAYYRFVPKGRWSVEYTLRLNNPGTFGLPSTRAEAMYAPELFGELPNAAMTIQAAQ